VAGINKHYRDLYARLHRQQENKGIATIKVEFDRYVETYWPGLLDVDRLNRINFSSPVRNIISKKEAAKLLGCRPERIDGLVSMGKLSRVVFKGRAHYLRDQAETIANTINSNWSMEEACDALQLTRYQLKQLLDAGIISVLQRPDEQNRDWVIDKAQCQSMIESLFQIATKDEVFDDAVSMGGIQRRGYSIVQLVSAMQTGKIKFRLSVDKNNPYSFHQFIDYINFNDLEIKKNSANDN